MQVDKKLDIGVLGMAVMGFNLARNIASRGFSVAIFNRSSKRSEEVSKAHPELTAFYELQDFVNAIKRPRRIILMVKAGDATDESIKALIPLLETGDLIMDGGNSYFIDSQRRAKELEKHGLGFLGCGISGGEEGALKGPSIMPGGDKRAFSAFEPILKDIAAKAPNGHICMDYVGPGGSGHYVKMVHNGIEYADMQLIAEAYWLLKEGAKLSNDDLASIFDEWNRGELESYLIDISKDIFKRKEGDSYLVDLVLDRAANKGTGKWTSQNALDLGEPGSLITQSVYARYLSFLKEQRIEASKVFADSKNAASLINTPKDFTEKVRKALYLSKLIAYAQGFSQLKAASSNYDWSLDYSKISRIFRAGCIIRAQFLDKIAAAYEKDPKLANLLLDPYFAQIAKDYQEALREVVVFAAQSSLAAPCFYAALSYFDAYKSANSPANLTQAQRDYFGAHGYERTDKPGSFHSEWI